MTETILVTGGTGALGRHLVPLLVASGRPVRVLSRSGGDVTGDLETGDGVEAAVAGATTVVHCAGSQKGDGRKARTIVDAAKRAGTVRHLVYISVVGADRVPVTSRADRMMFGYFGEKRAAELIVERSGLPWTTLRATQFHDLTLTAVTAMGKMPFVPVPKGVRFQPIETAEVAARLAELALGAPAGLVPDIAGPEVLGMDELVSVYLRVAGKRRPIVRMPLPGGAARAIRGGANLAPDRAVGVRTWADFLADRVPVAS